MIHPIPTGDLHVSTPTHVLGEITLMLNDFNRRCEENGHELVKVFSTASEFKVLLAGVGGNRKRVTWLDPLPRTVHPTAQGTMIRQSLRKPVRDGGSG